MPITALPAPAPSTSDPSTFDARADALFGALPTFVTEANALETNVNAKEVSAAASAASALSRKTDAEAAAALAALTVGAAKWVSGTTYAIGAVVWSPSNYLSYRRKTNGAGTTDPSSDTTNWNPLLPFSGSTKALAGTDTASAMTPADVQAAQAVVSNPKAMSQGVNLTASATVGGISNATSTVYKNTTNSFIFGAHVALPLWTTATVLRSCLATGAGYQLEVVATTGAFKVTLNATTYTSSIPGGGAASNLVAGTDHKIIAVVTVGATTTTVSFYLDNALLNTTGAQANVDVTNTNIYYTGGLATTRYAMTVYDTYDYNRALTAAEVLDLYRNGIAEADKWGSQTPIYTSDFSAGANSFTAIAGTTITGNIDQDADGAGVPPSNDWLRCERTDATSGVVRADRPGVLTTLKYNLVEVTIFNPPGSGITHFAPAKTITPIANKVIPIAVAEGTEVTAMFQLPATISTSCYMWATNAAGDSIGYVQGTKFYIKDLKTYYAGATLCLLPENAQPAPGQWLDSSSNKLHSMLPAAGASLTRPKKDFEYRWTNTWTASSAAQYVGGLNQAVLSADHFITDIITQATVTTDVKNLELGDGSDADRFVAAFAPSATRTKQTIAAQSDGTNLKLVYTPAAEATMTVETIIRGFIWEP